MSPPGIGARFTDAWLIDGVRTPFADYNGALANVSPTDLGIYQFAALTAMLLAAELVLPRQVWAHGYVQWEGTKMSKSS
jgi:hypothetical protein